MHLMKGTSLGGLVLRDIGVFCILHIVCSEVYWNEMIR